jgi:hypothetical protein
MVAVVALVAWTTAVVIGLAMLLRWRRPPRVALVHLATASVGLAAWVGYLAADRPGWLAWAVFAWLNITNALGDVLMVGGWRSRTPEPRPRAVRAYLASARDLLRGRRRLALAHGLLAPVTLVLVFTAALVG